MVVAVVKPRVVIPVTFRSSKVFGPDAIAVSIVAVVVASRDSIFLSWKLVSTISVEPIESDPTVATPATFNLRAVATPVTLIP